MDEYGQGALEYLLLIAGAVLVAAVVIYLLGSMAEKGKTSAEDAGSKIDTGLENINKLT